MPLWIGESSGQGGTRVGWDWGLGAHHWEIEEELALVQIGNMHDLTLFFEVEEKEQFRVELEPDDRGHVQFVELVERFESEPTVLARGLNLATEHTAVRKAHYGQYQLLVPTEGSDAAVGVLDAPS